MTPEVIKVTNKTSLQAGSYNGEIGGWIVDIIGILGRHKTDLKVEYGIRGVAACLIKVDEAGNAIVII